MYDIQRKKRTERNKKLGKKDCVQKISLKNLMYIRLDVEKGFERKSILLNHTKMC